MQQELPAVLFLARADFAVDMLGPFAVCRMTCKMLNYGGFSEIAAGTVSVEIPVARWAVMLPLSLN